MTEEILQSDIDLARKLITVGCGDAEIVQALQYRRIAPERASILVQELRQGRQVEPDKDSNPVVPRAYSEPARPAASSLSRPLTSSREHRRSRKTRWFPILVGASVLLCVGVLAVINHRTHSRFANARVGTTTENR